MQEKRSLGVTIYTLANAIKRRVDEQVGNCAHCEATRMQGWVIGFIAEHKDEDVFQRDIESRFCIRRSTATGILQVMEKNGLLVRESVGYDARLKKLILTPKALQMHRAVGEAIRLNEQQMLSCLTDEEQECFFMLSDKLIAALESESSEGKEQA